MSRTHLRTLSLVLCIWLAVFFAHAVLHHIWQKHELDHRCSLVVLLSLSSPAVQGQIEETLPEVQVGKVLLFSQEVDLAGETTSVLPRAPPVGVSSLV